MKIPLIVFALLSIFACQEQKIVSEQELKDYILDPEHGLRKQKEKNGIDIEVIYRPTDLIIAQQLGGVTDVKERGSIIRNFDTLSYFVIKLSRKGQEVENAYVSDNEKFVRVTNYLSSSIASNIYIVLEKDTLHALDAVYARMYGAASATSVMAVFNTDVRKKNGTLKFFLDDTELDLGQIEFEFDIKDIKKTPTLNLK